MRLLAMLLASGLLSACSGMPLLSGEDNADPPAELEQLSGDIQLKQLWSRDVGVGFDEQFVRLVPTVYGEHLLVADRKGRVSALSADSGTLLWKVDTGVLISAGPGAGEGLVLVASSDGEVLALGLDDGAPVWRAQVSSEVLAVPQIDLGVVVVQTADGKVVALGARDGKQLWIYDRTVPVLTLRGTSTPAVERGVVIAGFASGKVAALSTERGFVAWETNVAIPQGRTELERMVDIDSDPVIAGSSVYVTTFQGRLAVIDVQSGDPGWTRDMSSFAGLGVDYSQVYVTDEHSNVWALARDSGASVWKQEKLHNRGLTGPEPYNDYVAVGDFEGYLHLLSRYDGHIAARTRVDGKGIGATPLAVGDKLYVYGNGGTLAAYTLSGG
jgi:outer membrane protein assembly factor BamB